MGNPILTIDLTAIAQNWQGLNSLSGKAVQTSAVVKANAYGLGLVPVAEALITAGVQHFFVATTTEGVQLRKIIGPEPVIQVFSGHGPGGTTEIQAANLVPVLNSPEQFRLHQTSLPNHAFGIQLDTGMSRLGFQPDAWSEHRNAILAAHPVLLMSHLACADTPDHPMNRRQLARFHRLTDGLNIPRSLAATGGILLGPDYHFDLTRPGIGLYGCLPYDAAQPVLNLSLPVIQIRHLTPGDTVGYANSWTATEKTRIATLAAGYADGLPRSLSNKGNVYHGPTPCPLIGRVSMDMITVDISHLPGIPDSLNIICEHQSADRLATDADTIGYEILTSLGARYERRYKGAQ